MKNLEGGGELYRGQSVNHKSHMDWLGIEHRAYRVTGTCKDKVRPITRHEGLEVK